MAAATHMRVEEIAFRSGLFKTFSSFFEGIVGGAKAVDIPTVKIDIPPAKMHPMIMCPYVNDDCARQCPISSHVCREATLDRLLARQTFVVRAHDHTCCCRISNAEARLQYMYQYYVTRCTICMKTRKQSIYISMHTSTALMIELIMAVLVHDLDSVETNYVESAPLPKM
jgi:hypothetical protein